MCYLYTVAVRTMPVFVPRPGIIALATARDDGLAPFGIALIEIGYELFTVRGLDCDGWLCLLSDGLSLRIQQGRRRCLSPLAKFFRLAWTENLV